MDKHRDLLLFVDDEEQALKYFTLAFAKDHEVLTASNADQAWALIEQHAGRLALVISDQRMPGRSGVELLTATKERCPRAVRLLTTAYSDLSSAIDAVNHGAIFSYVTKPWKIEELRMTIRQALQFHHLQCERDALLADKLSVFQQLLLADRTRVLGMVTAGMGGQVRRPLAAAAAWLRDRQGAFAGLFPVVPEVRDLWTAVLDQCRATAGLAGGLSTWLAANRGSEVPMDLGALLSNAAAGQGGARLADHPTFTLFGDHRLLTAGFSELFRLVHHGLRSPGSSATVTVRGDHANAAINLRLSGGQEPDGEPERAGLAAYLAIHHAHGSITVPSWSDQDGRRIEIVLGGSDDDGMESFLAQMANFEHG